MLHKPLYTQEEINALQVVNQIKYVLTAVPMQLGVTGAVSITATVNFQTGELSYDIVTAETTPPVE